MGSRVKGQTTQHQPLLSSLVVRPVGSEAGVGVGAAVSDYEPGEMLQQRRLLVDAIEICAWYIWGCQNWLHWTQVLVPLLILLGAYIFGLHWNFSGYRMRASSVSPLHRRGAHRSYSPGFERSSGAPHSRGFGSGRNPSRYQGSSPPYGRMRDGSRFAGRGYDRSGRRPGPFRVEGLSRNNPNVRPREGDWICSDPSCKNLNFARRDYCNNCNRSRYAQPGSPRRGYPGPPFPPRQGFPGPTNHSPGRIMNGSYKSPTRGWPRHDPRDFGAARPSPRNETRYPDPPFRSGRDYPEDTYSDRCKYDRTPTLLEWDRRDRGRDDFLNERSGGYGRRVLSPSPELPLLPTRGWGTLVRERSRSPVRARPKEFQTDIYLSQGRGERRGVGAEGF